MGAIDPSFSAERCADLHNRLLQKEIANEPSAVVERSLITGLLDVSTDVAGFSIPESSPLHHFLSLLDTVALPHSRFIPLTPEIYQPFPEVFWSNTFSHKPGVILLYGQNNAESPMDGGLFLDLQTCKVVWHWSPGPFPASEKWVSLEFALQAQLDKWESGKFYWDTDNQSLAIKRWIEADLRNSLYAWDRLLSTIEAKLPRRGQKQQSRLEPLDVEIMSSFRIGGFAREFLSLASRPEFRHVAPGISAFSPETLFEIYSKEPPDSFRRTFNLAGEDEEDWVNLLLLASNTVPQDVSQNSEFDIKSFDEGWGYGKFTVNRRAGLYTEPGSIDLDAVRLIANSGLPTACQFDGRCPWGPSRSPRLLEVLYHWTSLVENGIWKVDADGVADDNSWFDANLRQSKLNWDPT
ncbi:hypothetical protein VE00_07418 [Pseudogymnoascus sp. WSF 3629]|nr:hypothetical protein VE00_07418 [Pseudogymnoascus sp. WSF 3629]